MKTFLSPLKKKMFAKFQYILYLFAEIITKQSNSRDSIQVFLHLGRPVGHFHQKTDLLIFKNLNYFYHWASPRGTKVRKSNITTILINLKLVKTYYLK